MLHPVIAKLIFYEFPNLPPSFADERDYRNVTSRVAR
jgi:hypothetical protein